MAFFKWNYSIKTFLESSPTLVSCCTAASPLAWECWCRPDGEHWHSSVSPPVSECLNTPVSQPVWEPDCKTSAPPLEQPRIEADMLECILGSRKRFRFLSQTSLWTKGGQVISSLWNSHAILQFSCQNVLMIDDWCRSSALTCLHSSFSTWRGTLTQFSFSTFTGQDQPRIKL